MNRHHRMSSTFPSSQLC
uniref:Uncharacterized protein n=1 Tax=Anguilla anguilla TaxID=7936 RepID=A0A0E9VAM2_ANGAN